MIKKFTPVLLTCLLFFFSFYKSIAQCVVDLGPDVALCVGSSVMLDAGPGFVTYQWSTGANTQTINVTSAGIYSVTVTDNLSNTCSDAVNITVLPLPTVLLSCTNVSCSQCTDGSITANVTGGTAPYSYNWLPGGQTTQSIFNMPAGTYTLTVVDVNGCLASNSCTILGGPVGTGAHLIEGNVFLDLDSNGIKNAGEQGLLFSKVLLIPDSLITYTDTSGNYAFMADSGSHTIQFIPKTNWIITTDSLTYTLNVVSGNYSGYDFGTIGDLTTAEIACGITPSTARCGQNVPFWINANIFSYIPQNGYVKLILDTAVDFVNSAPPPSLINGDTITWNFTAPPVSYLNYNITLHIPVTVGYVFNTLAEVSLTDGGSNIIASCFDTAQSVVTCSYDPNDKLVEPAGYGPQHTTFTDLSPFLEYTVRFQNTGNDTAFTVVINDQLDLNLDVSNFSVLRNSHPVKTTILNHLVEFRFNNILLPDSNTNEPASHGFVTCRIPVLPAIIPPFVVYNRADIYFDVNAAVSTNTVFNTMQLTTGIPENSENQTVFVFPNPFSETTSINFKNDSYDLTELSIFDLLSRKLTEISSSGNQFIVERKNLVPGVYFFLLKNTATKNVLKGKLMVE